MAKDPAFLFYYQDFFTGVSDMTNEEVGAYIRCMCVQAAKGGITEKHMLIICNSHEIQKTVTTKFERAPDTNLFYNPRLRDEIEKRKNYSLSRSKNRSSKKDMLNISETYVQHMENENENINEDVIDKGGAGGKRFVKPTLEEVINYMISIEVYDDEPTKLFDYYESNGWYVGKKPMKDWKAACRNWKRNMKPTNTTGRVTRLMNM
jgi:hypothetical protein